MGREELIDVRASMTLRVATFAVGVGLILLGFDVFLLFTIVDVLDFVLSAYYLLFGFLVCLSELPFDCILERVSFLKYFFGKALFLCFLGTITFKSDLFNLIVSVACFVCAGLYLVLALGFRNCLKPTEDSPELKPVSYGAMEDQKPLKT